MKIARFAADADAPHPLVGLVLGDVVQPVAETLDALVAGAVPTPVGGTLPLAEVRLEAPLPESCRGLLCTGINYVAHQQESADAFEADVPQHPIIFFKTPSAVTGPGPVALDASVSTEFDWEVELGVVIGRAGRNIAAEDAADHVFGYTVVNDVTARDVQHRHKQWHLGKNVDRSTPVGPWIVTADELGAFPPARDLDLEVNGAGKQTANTKDMIFSIAEQIAVISRYVELVPGDVIATGTPAGVGFSRTPAEFLVPGDRVVARIDGIGELVTEVAAPGGVLAPVGGAPLDEAVAGFAG